MSGPKVVNIAAVSRRQKREGLAALRQLEHAIAACQRFDTQTAAAGMLERLHQLRDSEQWADLSNEAPRHRDFYREHLQHLQRQHAESHAASLRRAHRHQQAATQQTIIDADTSQTTKTKQLRTHAAAFTDPTAITTGLPAAPADPHEQRLEKCWDMLGRLSAFEDTPVLAALTAKAAAIQQAPVARQPILLDSLALELGTHLQQRREMLDAIADLQSALAELDEIDTPAAADWQSKITAQLAKPSTPEALRDLARDAQAWTGAAMAEQTRQDQRTAILRALAHAGYEVREGMATAWAEDGRIVVRKPHETQYGVEVSAPPSGNAFQTRVVALSHSRDPQRDLEIEQTWCGDFQHARALLHADGFETTLLHAHDAGVIPLKSVASPAHPHAHQETRKPLSRSNNP